MKKYNNEDVANEEATFPGNWPQQAAHFDRDDREEEDRDEEEEEDENADWGNIDPAGGDEPTSPGSAV